MGSAKAKVSHGETNGNPPAGAFMAAAFPRNRRARDRVARSVIARQNGNDESIAHQRSGLDQLETALAAVPERLS
jgi:hypothetical protein